MQWSIFLSSLAIVASPATAWQYISPDALPSDTLSASCIAALVVDISCPSQVVSFFVREPVPLDSLEEACTSQCRASLADFEASLKTQCGEDDVVEYDIGADPVHVSVVATDIYYHFNRTCIKDGDRWCNIWAFENSPDNDSGGGSSAPTATASVDMCDNCIIKPFQFLAGNPYSNGFALQPDYSTLTESCSKTDFPLATTATEDPPTTPDPEPPCSGVEYTIQAEDTCQSISSANNVATAWMLYDNGLPAFCAGFPAEGEKICIVNQCNTYTVQADDTCQGIAAAANITMVQLYTWNPILGPACNRMSLSVGDSICLEPHGDEDYTPPTHTPTTPAPEPTAAPVPSNIANGTNEHCAQYYSVQQGDYCNQIVIKFSISLADFLFLNQGVNAECTNLFAEESYCVSPVGPINMYPGHPDYVAPTPTLPHTPFSDLPKATFVPPAITDLPTYLPRAPGTRNDCLIYVNGTDLQIDMSWGFSFSACSELVETWDISLAELQNWNPSLNTTSPDCAPSEEYSYCMAAYKKTNTYTPAPTTSQSEPEPSTTSGDTPADPTPSELPIRDGAAENCKTYYPVVSGQTCQEVLDDNNLTIAEFYAMNPSIGPECYNLWPDYRYCVEV
ncbi:carbohydrate-binding module family 50 protein [Sodiomyces alcalophilus JCM 7366]|uniref:carbohydrate-binding module family 50 protein n=1 Tax=Sodiomyces alcalophilus JCM 7366 TaxID=591952 RepID=UPI0039B66460